MRGKKLEYFLCGVHDLYPYPKQKHNRKISSITEKQEMLHSTPMPKTSTHSTTVRGAGLGQQ